jgi:integrase
VQLKPSTRLGYETIVRAAILPRWANVSLADLTHAGIQNWLTEVAATAAPSTTRSYHRVMSMMLKYAVRDGRLSRNPADGAKLPRIVKGRHPYLTHAQVQHLAHLAGEDGDVVLFLAYTGLRWGEMAALRVKDLDMLRRRVNVDQAVTEVRRDLIYGTPKNHSRRSVPFPSFLTEMLAQHCEGKAGDDFVFTAPQGGALRNRNWRRRSFEPLTPHDLRHTAASLAISAGANVKAVQKMLGHASAAMTLDVYADLFDDDLDAVGEALSQAGDPAVVGKMWANGGQSPMPVTPITRTAP